MKALVLGALLGLLLALLGVLPAAVTVAAALASQPLLVAFALGAAARPRLPAVGRWQR